MEKYKVQKTVGVGSFASVSKAINTKNGEIVAIKKMKKKFSSWEECMSLREIKSLRKLNHPSLSPHPNIIKLLEVNRVNDELYCVFEFVEQNIYQVYLNYKEKGKSMPESEIRSLIYQTASGLAFMHKHGFFHRDLKPENLLYQNSIVKIADFGLAREVRSRPPYTDYVATRWYRAPEILMKSTIYNSPVDIYALGCIMAELFILSPLFSGSSELDQIHKMCSILGTPTQSNWSEGLRLALQKPGFSFPQYPPIPLSSIIPGASVEAVQLIGEMLRWDPAKRPSATQVLQHPFFNGFIPPALPIPSKKEKGVTERVTQLNSDDYTSIEARDLAPRDRSQNKRNKSNPDDKENDDSDNSFTFDGNGKYSNKLGDIKISETLKQPNFGGGTTNLVLGEKPGTEVQDKKRGFQIKKSPIDNLLNADEDTSPYMNIQEDKEVTTPVSMLGGFHLNKGPKQFSMDSERNINSINTNPGNNMMESTSLRNKSNFSLPSSNYVNRVLGSTNNNAIGTTGGSNIGSNITSGGSNIGTNTGIGVGLNANMVGFDNKQKLGPPGTSTNPNVYTSYQNPINTQAVDPFLKYPALGGGQGGGSLGFANTTNRNALLNKYSNNNTGTVGPSNNSTNQSGKASVLGGVNNFYGGQQTGGLGTTDYQGSSINTGSNINKNYGFSASGKDEEISYIGRYKI